MKRSMRVGYKEIREKQRKGSPPAMKKKRE